MGLSKGSGFSLGFWVLKVQGFGSIGFRVITRMRSLLISPPITLKGINAQ